MRALPRSISRFGQIKVYLVLLSILISVVVVATFLYLANRTDKAMKQRLQDQAESYADLLQHTKSWNYALGGVYALKQEGDPTLRYLQSFGIDPEIRSVDGRIYTVKNHAIMLSEISRLSAHSHGVTFRLVSPDPIDPRNRPDPFDTEAFRAFSTGERRHAAILDDPLRYRFLTPLFADESCLQCHQAKRPGELIGAISISIPAGEIVARNRLTRKILLLGGVGILGAILLVVFVLTWRLADQLDEINYRLHKQATTDELTGLRNRRRILRRLEEEFSRSGRVGTPLSLIVFDIDHFKRINDTHGHQFGDLVLKRIAQLMQETVRPYDLVGRIGGEEFLVVTPSTTLDEATAIAERIRELTERERIGDENRVIHVTVSAGVSTMNQDEDSMEALIKRADDALYRAKNGGRNQVATQ